MFNFDLKRARIYQAVKWEKCFVFKFAQFFKKIFLVLFFIAFLLFLYGFLLENFSQSLNRRLLGVSVIFLVLVISFWRKELFLNSKLKKPILKTKLADALIPDNGINLAEFLNFEVAKAVWQAIRFAKKKNLPRVSSEALLYFSLKEWPEANFIFNRALLNLEKIKKELKNYLDSSESKEFQEVLSEDFQKVILDAVKIAQKNSRQRIKLGDILISQSRIDPTLKKYLVDSNLKVEDIENLTLWLEFLEEKIEKQKRFWEYENLAKRQTLAKAWTAGYTISLDQFSTDLSETVKRQGFPEVIGHQKEIEQMERILASREINNVLIVGEAGSGRKSMVQALAIKSLLGRSLPEVNFKRVVQLDLPSLIAQIGPEKIESVLDTIFQEAVLAGNIILVIDEFHNFVWGTSRPGAVNISGIIFPYLALPQLQIVAITTFQGLHKYIEQNSSLLALFEKVELSEISLRETLTLLEKLALFLERKYKKFISYPSLREIVSLTDRYLPALPFPEKAMEILDEVVIYVASQTKDKIVLPSHVAKIITEKTQIPIGEIEAGERQTLLNLENLIHQRIINQEEAVKEVSAALRRARAGVTIRKGPIGVFLFLGPTGVGKTETSKSLAELYFGAEEKMIRLDMSEFQTIEDIARLLGEPGQEGLLTTPVKENPFSLILLDELEKAHPNVLNLFLQVFDEGHLTDGQGRKIDFKNSIIIATSNAGYQVILRALEEKEAWLGVKQKLLDFLFSEAIFRPEFINRFDAVVVFRPLTKENLLDIAELLFQKLNKNLKEKGVELIITNFLKEKIVELGYNPVFGAREMRRVIQDKVENVLASALLSGKLKRGQKVEIDPKTFELKI